MQEEVGYRVDRVTRVRNYSIRAARGFRALSLRTRRFSCESVTRTALSPRCDTLRLYCRLSGGLNKVILRRCRGRDTHAASRPRARAAPQCRRTDGMARRAGHRPQARSQLPHNSSLADSTHGSPPASGPAYSPRPSTRLSPGAAARRLPHRASERGVRTKHTPSSLAEPLRARPCSCPLGRRTAATGEEARAAVVRVVAGSASAGWAAAGRRAGTSPRHQAAGWEAAG